MSGCTVNTSEGPQKAANVDVDKLGELNKKVTELKLFSEKELERLSQLCDDQERSKIFSNALAAAEKMTFAVKAEVERAKKVGLTIPEVEVTQKLRHMIEYDTITAAEDRFSPKTVADQISYLRQTNDKAIARYLAVESRYLPATLQEIQKNVEWNVEKIKDYEFRAAPIGWFRAGEGVWDPALYRAKDFADPMVQQNLSFKYMKALERLVNAVNQEDHARIASREISDFGRRVVPADAGGLRFALSRYPTSLQERFDNENRALAQQIKDSLPAQATAQYFDKFSDFLTREAEAIEKRLSSKK